MWSFKEFAEGRSRRENIDRAVGLLRGLPKAIPEIRSLEVGMNAIPSRDASDIVLCVDFEDPAALDRYQDHPAHREVAGFIGKVRETRSAIDYEV